MYSGGITNTFFMKKREIVYSTKGRIGTEAATIMQ